METTTAPAPKSAKARAAARDARRAEYAAAILARHAELAATWHPCPEPGCTQFPFETEADLAEHLAAGNHTGASDPSLSFAGRAATEQALPEWGDGTGTGAKAAPVNLATEKQVAFLARLVSELDALTGTTSDPAALQGLTKAAASKAIDAAQEQLTAARAQAPATAAPAAAVRANRYAGRCATCGTEVPEGAGALTKEAGRWVTRHLPGACAAKATAAPATAPGIELVPGRVYATADGRIGKVTESKAGRLYAKERQVDGWEYDAGLLAKLVRPVSAEEAAAWGHEHHSCCFCGRHLEDDGPARSMEVGYGPVCADKYGLPWG